jgi:hypothetical protein
MRCGGKFSEKDRRKSKGGKWKAGGMHAKFGVRPAIPRLSNEPRFIGADIFKPKARLGEPWVNVVINLFGAAERRPKYFGGKNLPD